MFGLLVSGEGDAEFLFLRSEFEIERTDCVHRTRNDEFYLKLSLIIDINLRINGGSLHFKTFTTHTF